MSEFLYLYRNGEKLSPEQMQQQIGRWMAWMKELEGKGGLKNVGHPLERSGVVVSGATRTVTDGLFAEAKDVVGGYSIVDVFYHAALGQLLARAGDCTAAKLHFTRAIQLARSPMEAAFLARSAARFGAD